jgi:hypothetical protein
MSVVERKHRRVESRQILRWLAAGCAGLFCLNMAAQASFAGGGSVGTLASYGGNGRDKDDDDGLGTEDIALIVVGGAALAALVYGAMHRGDSDEATTTTSRNAPSGETVSALPARAQVSEVRLVSGKSAVESGTSCRFDLQARSQQDGKWYSVTSQPGASIDVREGGSVLVRQGGTKNAFCVPITTAKAEDGKSVTVVGTFQPAGGALLTAETAVSVQVP